jgi:hypothetical protein
MTRTERMLPAHGAAYSHSQTPWWAGYDDARDGRPYDNWRSLHTNRYEYWLGYQAGAPKHLITPDLTMTDVTPARRLELAQQGVAQWCRDNHEELRSQLDRSLRDEFDAVMREWQLATELFLTELPR